MATYEAINMATIHLVGKPQKNLRARIQKDWVYLYHNDKPVFNCNKIFFEKNFIKETK